MKNILFTILFFHLLSCSDNSFVPANFKKIGTVKSVDISNKDILINYNIHIPHNNLKEGDEIYIFQKSNKIPLKIESISTWTRCILKDNSYDLNNISEEMNVYLDLNNYIYQGVIKKVTDDFKNQFSDFSKTSFYKNMSEKIYKNWHPPQIMNNHNSDLKIEPFPKENIKVVIVLNKKGDVIDVRIIESNGYPSVDDSCIDAIKFSKNFGILPKNMESNLTAIPFVFYYNPI